MALKLLWDPWVEDGLIQNIIDLYEHRKGRKKILLLKLNYSHSYIEFFLRVSWNVKEGGDMLCIKSSWV